MSTRDEYLAVTWNEVHRIATGRDDSHIVVLTADTRRLREQFNRKVADLGVPPVRASLMHRRVWDGVVAYPRLRHALRGRGLQRLLLARYTAEVETIKREILAYREMVPFAKRPCLLGEHLASDEVAAAPPPVPAEDSHNPDIDLYRREKARRKGSNRAHVAEG